MADIVEAIDPMNDIEIDSDAPITEALFTKIGANINGLIKKTWVSQTFTASGTFTVPADVYDFIVEGYGGGGGGAGANGGAGTGSGGGGGAGSQVGFYFVATTPATTYSVVIGAGGAGGAAAIPGTDGVTSSIPGLNFRGGQGGQIYYGGLPNGGSGITNPGLYGASAQTGGSSFRGAGGAGGVGAGSGGGGGGSFSGGGAGGAFNVAGSAASANSGAGGGGGGQGSPNRAGGAGGSGRVIFHWLAV